MGKYSSFRGVTRWTGMQQGGARGAWSANLCVRGVKWISHGHETERAAAIARDKRVLELGLDLPLNVLKRV